MNQVTEHTAVKTVDSIQQRLTEYACNLDYHDIPAEVVHAAKMRIIDNFGALIGGFFGDACGIVRNLAAQMPNPNGATVIGTRFKTTPDMAAYVNGTTARFVEMNDIYHWLDSYEGHPSDALTPVFSVAEHARVSGSDFITGVVLAYEVFQRISDIFHNRDFDNTTFCCLATAVAAGKLLRLSPVQLSHCISMAIVPNNILRQVRLSHLSMYKSAAAGHAGRAGVFAALLARAGMEGPHLPFEGKAGWCEHISRERFSLDTLGGNATPFKIMDTRIKLRASCASTISSILAAETLAPCSSQAIKQVTVEVYKKAKDGVGTGEHNWNPESRETADHSIPYVVAATLMDGTVTGRSFNDSHLWNPELRALMQKIEVVENKEFTQAFERSPQEHHTRITLLTSSGQRLVGKSGGDQDDLAAQRTDAQIVEKFRGLTEEVLGVKRVNSILDLLWHLDEVSNVAEMPPVFVLD